MKAKLLLWQKSSFQGGGVIEMIILAFIPEGRSEPTVLYDNHHPKGHHKHIDGQEFPCVYSSVARLRSDFLIDATNWKERKEGLS